MARSLSAAALLPLLRTLADGAWHSGAVLAREAGITRAALAKRVRKLQQWGVAIETQPGRGCRLAQPLELLDAARIRDALPAAWRDPVTVRVLPSTDSTNSQLMAAGAGDPQVLLAEHQTAGRGRQGRAWHSPFGANLYMSLAWTWPQWPAAVTALPLAAGVATAQALAALALPGVRLKWPNDLWCGDAKLGGILIEQRGEASGACRVVIGLGLNVAMRGAPATAIDQPWTTLTDCAGTVPSRNALAARILAHWLDMLERFGAEGFAPFASAFRELDLTHGRAVTVRLPEGSVGGIARGVDGTGALLVDTGEAQRRIFSGDVSLRLAS